MAYNYEFPYTDPNFYNDDWLLSKMKELLVWMEETDTWKNEYAQAYEDFKRMIEDIENGTFPESVQNAFYKWMKLNALDLVGEMVKCVFFEISLEGYFIAWIPDGWEDIIFNTTYYDIVLSAHPEYEYGHLVLSY